MRRVVVQEAPFDAGVEIARVQSAADGGIGCFVGVVRGGAPIEGRATTGGGATTGGEDPVEALELEHYPGMTEQALAEIADAAIERFSLGACTLIHRVGVLRPGEPIVLVVTSAPHRAAALDATRFLIDWMKTRAPFWKREHFRSGASRWVEARIGDEEASAAWDL